MKLFTFFLALFSLNLGVAQNSFDVYITGNPEDVQTSVESGIVLAGGGGDHDEAMKWFLEKAEGGDIVVIRSSGSDGYNDYFYSELGVNVNSVTTIVWNSIEASADSDVIETLTNAEAIWIAGGDQSTYVNYWKDNAIEELLNDHILVKNAPIGGTSAGMAILGGSYFSASNGTVYSDECLENPYNEFAQIGHNDFLEAPHLENVITDTHYDDPDRRGRHVSFMARMFQDENKFPLGIACDEYSAVCIDADGIAHCYGEYPDFEDYIYFIRPNCNEPFEPEICLEESPLTWNRNQEALKAYRISAELDGNKFFDLNDWISGQGGEWQTWYVESGEIFYSNDNNAPDCPVSITSSIKPGIRFYPNPAIASLSIESANAETMSLYDSKGKIVLQKKLAVGKNDVNVSNFQAGLYLLKVGTAAERLIIGY